MTKYKWKALRIFSNLFHLRTIIRKLFGSFFLMVILMMLLGGFSYYSFNKLNNIHSLIKSFKDLKYQIAEIKDALSLFLLYEETNLYFMNKNRSIYVAKHNKRYKNILLSLNTLQKHYQSIGMGENNKLDSLSGMVHRYHDRFLEIRKKIKQKGFADYHFEGEFTKTMKQLESYDFGEHKIALSRIRFYKKEYFLSGDSIILRNLRSEISNFYSIIESNIAKEKVLKVTKILQNFETAFNDLVTIDEAIGISSDQGLQGTLNSLINDVYNFLNELDDEVATVADESKFKIYLVFIIFVVIIIIVAFSTAYLLSRQISNPILKLKSNIVTLSKGMIPEIIEHKAKDEIGDMTEAINKLVNTTKNTSFFAESIGKGIFTAEYSKSSYNDVLGTALIKMRDNLSVTSEFAEKIGKGDFLAEYKKLSDDDVLGTALINMRENLKKNFLYEEERNWKAKGYAKFGEILQRSDNLDKLGFELISTLVDYLDAYQSVVYAVDDINAKDKNLKIIASYAFNEKIDTHKKYKFGEGLIGETARTQKTIQIKNVPNNYLRISSGLVEGKPVNLLISPLILNKITYGVIELASLNIFKPIQIEFVKELGEKIAVAFSNIKANEFTKYLLKESQEKAQELQVREEELKQQNEELNTTQDKVKSVNEELNEVNKRMKDSIDYAKRIHQSILPITKNIQEVFPQSFIYYKPKDVIGGDFPWFYKKGDDIYIATVDCTGHGVPGALLSLIGYFLLNEIVGHKKILTPAEVLNLLDTGVRTTLRQQDRSNADDGMDIALCKVNMKDMEVQFSGAYRPLYYLNGGLSRFKGDRHPIGGIRHQDSGNFTNHTVKITKGDSMYFFTDGLPDQFGGPNPEEDQFSVTRLQKIILKNQELVMPELAKKIDDEFQQWKGDNFQYDDVLMIGIRF